MARILALGELGRFALFLGAGAVNTLFGYSAFALCIALGMPNDLSVLVCTIAGALFNFRTIGAVFAANGLAALPRFVIAYALIAPANMLLLRVTIALGAGAYLGEALVIAILAPISFLAMRRFVFPAAREHAS